MVYLLREKDHVCADCEKEFDKDEIYNRFYCPHCMSKNNTSNSPTLWHKVKKLPKGQRLLEEVLTK